MQLVVNILHYILSFFRRGQWISFFYISVIFRPINNYLSQSIFSIIIYIYNLSNQIVILIYFILEFCRMGATHKISHEDQTASEIIKKKDQINFIHEHFIRQFQGDIQAEYNILSPALVSNNFYELRKIIHKKTKLCKAAVIINKYKVRSQQRELLQQQINKLKKIDNPFLLKIYQLSYDKHRFYIVCQFFQGLSLAQILLEQNSIPERKAARILYQILYALSECHRNNIFHSDLKLENITFNSNTQQVIKITDFGFSRIFRVQSIVSQCKRKAFLAAPQALDGSPQLKSDIWSCGIILYILLSGEAPIAGTSHNRLRLKMAYFEPNFHHQKFEFISKEAKNLLKMMLKQNPEHRPSADQCLNHEWIKKYYQPISIPPSIFSRILMQAFNFNPSSKLQEATWGLYVNAFISFHQKQYILHVFSFLDEKCKGTLNLQDLQRGFKLFMNERRAKFFASFIFERHKSTPITFSQFVSISTNREFLVSEQNNKHLFKIFDDDDSGQISVNQLKSVLGASKQIPEQIWMQLMKEADENSDGLISFEEFSHMMRELKNTNNQRYLQLLNQQSEQ